MHKYIIAVTAMILLAGCTKAKPVDTTPYMTIKMSTENANLIFTGTLDNRKGQEHIYKHREKDGMYDDAGKFKIEKCLKGSYSKEIISLPYIYYDNDTRPSIGCKYIVFAYVTDNGRSTQRIIESSEDNIKKVEEEIKANQKPSGNPAPPSS